MGSKEPMLGRFDVMVIPIFDFHLRLLAIHFFRWLLMSHIDSREVSRRVCYAFFALSMNERDDYILRSADYGSKARAKSSLPTEYLP